MADKTPDNADSPSKLATDITIAWLQNPNVQPDVADVSNLLKTVLAALDSNSRGAAAPVEPIPQSETAPPKAQGKPVKGKTGTKATPPKTSVPASDPVTAEATQSSTGTSDNSPKAARPARTDRKPKASGLALLKGLSAPATAASTTGSASEVPTATKPAASKRGAAKAAAPTAAIGKTEAKIASAARAAPKRDKAKGSAPADTVPSTEVPVPAGDAPKRARPVLKMKFGTDVAEPMASSSSATKEAEAAKTKATPKPRRMAREAKPAAEPAPKA